MIQSRAVFQSVILVEQDAPCSCISDTTWIIVILRQTARRVERGRQTAQPLPGSFLCEFEHIDDHDLILVRFRKTLLSLHIVKAFVQVHLILSYTFSDTMCILVSQVS